MESLVTDLGPARQAITKNLKSQVVHVDCWVHADKLVVNDSKYLKNSSLENNIKNDFIFLQRCTSKEHFELGIDFCIKKYS